MKKVCLLVFGLWSLPLAAQQGGNNDLLISLYNQLEALQQEVQTLRGLVEEQGYQLRRMETEQRDRYLDIDRRLSGAAAGGQVGGTPFGGAPVEGGAVQQPFLTPGEQTTDRNDAIPLENDPRFATAQPGNQLPPSGRNATSPGAVTPGVTGSDPALSQMSEQDLYRTALNLLLEQMQYDESIRLFQAYIDSYPQGRLLTNAWYWQGEALILVARFSEARDVFTKILTDYPQDPKAAGAMLKLGVAYQQLGDRTRATQAWRELSGRYPEAATEIRAAQDYLSRQ
jgi:tol-pal system protein YbgF